MGRPIIRRTDERERGRWKRIRVDSDEMKKSEKGLIGRKEGRREEKRKWRKEKHERQREREEPRDCEGEKKNA
jgi:hypothetical protein